VGAALACWCCLWQIVQIRPAAAAPPETTTTACGFDRMSIDWLTYSAQVLDIGLDHPG